jgi:molybdopterin/thiamine biosynthesis adenylyltransferase
MVNDAGKARLDGVFDVDALRSKHVVVVGLGSGGSTVALELAKAGVSHFTLVDPDTVEPANLIRHECDDRYLGVNKAVAVRDLILHRDSRADVEAIPADIFDIRPQLGRLVAGADLVAVCVDIERPKHLLNMACIQAGTPAVYGGVYARAAGGEVIRCRGGVDDACYACVTSVLRESAPVPADVAELDYGAIDENGTLHGAPGLGLDVRMIALIHAKVCLLTLLGDVAPKSPDGPSLTDIPADVVLFGNEPMEGLFPRAYASALVQLARQEECLVCKPLRDASLLAVDPFEVSVLGPLPE